MGNVLESDTSGSDNEFQDSVLTETRTQGDGMETENAEGSRGVIGKETTSTTVPVFTARSSVDKSDINQQKIGAGTLKSETSEKGSQQKNNPLERESPKQLPPRDQLIKLKPPKINEKTSGSDHLNDSYNKISSSAKQREPKFVPYEPYKGATRSMTDDDTVMKSHSRKQSLGSSNSNSTSSIRSLKAETSPPTKVPQNVSQTNAGATMLKNYGDFQSDNNLNQGHTEMLLKERLKICEKDINELRTENARLKKMLVDSMSGFGSPNTTDFSQAVARSLEANGSSMSESVDNLTDEIEVWRSKFLSSCVLVEQLTKENQDWKRIVISAAELFRETKQSADVVLTPALFDKINTWLQQTRDPRLASPYKSSSYYHERHDITYDPNSS